MIGVVGPPSEVPGLATAIEEAGVSVRRGPADEVVASSPATIVAVGERALVDLVWCDADAPVLPVEAGPELGSIPTDGDAIVDALTGEYETHSYPTLAARVDGGLVGRAVFDVMLVTAAPSRISEFDVATDGPVDSFRADGVVVATPAGSSGYANAAGGPTVDSAVGGVAVVPVAPFELDADRRVLEPPIVLTVERDEHEVSLLLDGRERETVPPHRSVDVAFGDALDVVVPRRGLEKF